jgi:hypothetical protein
MGLRPLLPIAGEGKERAPSVGAAGATRPTDQRERAGFEPAMEISPHTRATRPLPSAAVCVVYTASRAFAP